MRKITEAQLVPETISLKGHYDLSAKVTPRCGANLVSFRVAGTEFIYYENKVPTGKDYTGAFNMFPTPCRLAGSSYEFEGKQIAQKKNGEDVFIHGLIRDEVMECRNEGHSIVSSLKIEPGHPVYEGFPFNCRFTITHELHESGLTVRFSLVNNDSCNIPFGYGIHPFWRIHGNRHDVAVRVPCDHILELAELVPTGKYLPVEGTELDLRSLRNIENLFIDNAFWRREAGQTAELVFATLGRKLVIEASDNFQHMIVYAPEGADFICVENLTTCPNAPNLVSAGKRDVAGMLVAGPGETVDGWIRYSIADP